MKRSAHLLLVGLGLRLDGHRNNGIRERRRLEGNRFILGAQSVTCRDITDADNGGDITGVAGVDIFTLISLDLDESADALTLAGAWVENCVAFA